MYPYNREWLIDSINIERYTEVKRNWDESKKLISSIREHLSTIDAEIASKIYTIATAGSLGRMEASPDVSDLDLILVLSDDIDPDSEIARVLYKSVWKALEPLNLQLPKSTGVFANSTSQKQLISDIGKANEKYEVFGKRLLILLESQPLYQDSNYTNLIRVIVERYADKYVKNDSKKEWTLLLNDLIRYFRSLAVNYQWDFENQVEKWAIRNIKLRHSRLLMYSGLLMLLGEASKERQDKVSWLQKELVKTPLERVAWVYEQNMDWNFHRVIGFYNVFLSMLNQPEIRKNLNFNPSELIDDTNNYNSYENRYENLDFANLKANSDGLIAEFLRFVLARRGAWTERFFEYLIF
jgi:hypothetical protein